MSQELTEDQIKAKKKASRQRVFTAVPIGAIVLLCIFYGNKSTIGLFAIITILGAVEMARMTSPALDRVRMYIYVVFAALPMIAVRFFDTSDQMYFVLTVISCIVMSILILNLWIGGKINYTKFGYPLTMLYWGLPFGIASAYLLQAGNLAYLGVLGIILLLWTSDTMAYFTGKKFGKHKLFPSVSPGKTVEGSLGAGVFSILISMVYAVILEQSFVKWVIIALVVWIVGTLGDLVESKMKRVQGVKDSGTLLPGHGGFLDRFDSLVMVIPFLLLLEYLFR